jgi:hypothetical protein
MGIAIGLYMEDLEVSLCQATQWHLSRNCAVQTPP